MKLKKVDELNCVFEELEMEHRKTVRYKCFVPVDANQQSTFSDLCTFDVGKGGLGLVSRKKVPIHKHIAVEVELSPNSDPAIVMGEVRWVRRDYETGTYRLGVKFIKVLSSGSRTRLTSFFGESHD